MLLYPHQRNTVAYLEQKCTNQHGLLLYHHMGTGKTNTAVGWLINRMHKYKSSSSKNSSKRSSSKPRRDAPDHHTRHKTRKRQRAGGTPQQQSRRSSSSSSSSDDSTSGARTKRSRTPLTDDELATRPFEYLIVCPESIKTTWLTEAADMGFTVDAKHCLLNYEEMQGLVQAKRFNVEHKNVIFDEAHNLCPIMRAGNMKYYTSILKQTNRADKLLLLTGTPEHSRRSDFTILINVAVGRNKFPIYDRELVEKYRDKTIFKKRKNSILFNWFKPVAYVGFTMLVGLVSKRISNVFYRWTRDMLTKRFNVRVFNAVKYLAEKRMGKKYDEGIGDFVGDEVQDDAEDVDVEEEDVEEVATGYDDDKPTKRHGGAWFSWSSDDTKATKQAVLTEVKGLANDLMPTMPTNAVAAQQAFTEMATGISESQVLGEGLEFSREIDSWLWNLPGAYFLSVIQRYTMAAKKFLAVTHDPERALREAPIQYERFAKDIGRYVSFKELGEQEVNFARKVFDDKPVEALYSSYQSRQCLFFIYGTMDLKMVRFYANVNKDGAVLKIGEFREEEGIEKYGRCISNMWEIVDDVLDKRVKYGFNADDGTIYLRWSSKRDPKTGEKHAEAGERVKKLQGCSKFHNIAQMLRDADAKGERSLIRSDFKKQGIYLLSAYLNSVGIPHVYIRKDKMDASERKRILGTYNNIYRRIKIKHNGKTQKGKLLEYVDDTKRLDDPAQIDIGATVIPHEPTEAWEGRTEGQVITREGDTCTVMYDPDQQLTLDIRVTEVYRVFSVRVGEDRERVHAKHIVQPLPPVDEKAQPPKVILLDDDSSEGISLMGVEHVHLLEPLLSAAQRDQALARAIRNRSHLHLPPARRRVLVHTHVGVIQPTRGHIEQTKAAIQKVMFEAERNEHINKHFSGIVPRACKTSIKLDPIGYVFDQYWNAVTALHPEIEESGTPDLMVYSQLANDEEHISNYTRFIRDTNVLGRDFNLPNGENDAPINSEDDANDALDDVDGTCVANDAFKMQLKFSRAIGVRRATKKKERRSASSRDKTSRKQRSKHSKHRKHSKRV